MRNLIIFLFTIFMAFSAVGQKKISATEAGYIAEAKSELASALSQADMSDSERLRIIKRSATTLKEYGQPAAWPDGDIPLQKWMDGQFEQCRSEISEMSDWVLKLEHQTLNQKMKLINTMQIEVLEHQVELLIPGKTPVQLTSDAVSTIFGINFAEGAGGGKRQDAQNLRDRFRKLAESKELVSHFNILIGHHRESLRLIDAERDDLRKKVPGWKQAYMNAYNGAFTFKEYQGTAEVNDNADRKPNSLLGTWKFGYPQTGYFYLTFNSNGEYIFEDKMNNGDTEKGKYSVNGNVLILGGPVSQCDKTEGTYHFVTEDNELEFVKIEDACLSRKFTLMHIWSRK